MFDAGTKPLVLNRPRFDLLADEIHNSNSKLYDLIYCDLRYLISLEFLILFRKKISQTILFLRLFSHNLTSGRTTEKNVL